MTQSNGPVREQPGALERVVAARPQGDVGLLAIYAQAYAYYQQGQYKSAASKLGYLHLRRPTNVKYLKALGACQFMLGDFEAAINTYSFVGVLFPHDAEAQCMCGHALLLTGQRIRARKILIRGLLNEAGAPQLRERARSLLELSEVAA